MLSFGWSPLDFLFPSSPLSILWWLHQASISCSIAFSGLKRGLGTYLSFNFLLPLRCDQPERQSPQSGRFSLFTITRYGRLVEIRWSVCISKSQIIFCVPFSWTDSGLCLYYLLVWSNLDFLQNSQWITLLTQSCLALDSFSANLLHSLIMWFIVSSLTQHKLHFFAASYLFLLWYRWFLWRCFVQISEEILFLS